MEGGDRREGKGDRERLTQKTNVEMGEGEERVKKSFLWFGDKTPRMYKGAKGNEGRKKVEKENIKAKL